MTQLTKLYARFLSGGDLSFAEFQRLLEAFGFRHVRTRGSHHVYVRDDVIDQITSSPRARLPRTTSCVSLPLLSRDTD